MPEYLVWVVAIVVVLILVWVLFSKVLKNKKIEETNVEELSIDVEVLLHALGGQENVESSEATNSKVSISLKDDTLVDVQALKDLGASGIVQSEHKVTVILGKISKAVSERINQKS